MVGLDSVVPLPFEPPDLTGSEPGNGPIYLGFQNGGRHFKMNSLRVISVAIFLLGVAALVLDVSLLEQTKQLQHVKQDHGRRRHGDQE